MDMNFEFVWNKPKKIEKMDVHSRKSHVAEATPKQIVAMPSGYRSEDILHSLCIIAEELIKTSEAQATALNNTLSVMKESLNDSKNKTSTKTSTSEDTSKEESGSKEKSSSEESYKDSDEDYENNYCTEDHED